MLPMILGLAGSALAPTIGLNALTAGAIGSGLGSYIETGDLGQGIQTGLLSFLGGKALGSMMGSGADAAAKAAPAMPANDAALQATGMGSPNVLGENIAATTPPAPSSTGFGDIFSMSQPEAMAPSNFSKDLAGAQAAAFNPYSLGAAGTAGLMMPPPDFEKKEYDFNTDEAEAKPRDRFTPPSTFRGGVDPEFNYFGPQRFAEGGITDLPMDMSEEPNDKEIIADAVEAIKGIDETPEITLARFVSRYGEDALRDLVQRVQSGEFDDNAETTEGMVNGAGDGMDDMIPATLEGEQDVVLSDGEFIVPADVVSGLGNGSTDAGSKALYEMMDRVRELRTGKKEQPDQVPLGQMMPA